MAYTPAYALQEPARDDVDALAGDTLIEFGAPWCGYCIAAQPGIECALAEHPQLRHLKIEDGRGRPLGRSFRIKLWPTLVLLRNGVELARAVRPDDAADIAQMLDVLRSADR